MAYRPDYTFQSSFFEEFPFQIQGQDALTRGERDLINEPASRYVPSLSVLLEVKHGEIRDD
jgi:hypothetical protein